MAFSAALQKYYQFSKPGIVYANCLTAVAGYLLGSQLRINAAVLSGLLIGLSLVIIGACASNNYLDRSIDAQMPRTKRRALVTGTISSATALIYAMLTTVSGLLLLTVTQHWLTVALAATAWIDYVVLYGYWKRRSVHGTLVGCVSGAIPLVAGYTTTTGRFDLTAGLLFLLMVVWQMGHFYGIALYRLKDYRAGGIPVMPAVRGVATTKRQAVGYIAGFIVVAILLGAYGRLGLLGGAVLAGMGGYWLYRAGSQFTRLPSARWGKQVFLTSLLVMVVMTATLSLSPLFS